MIDKILGNSGLMSDKEIENKVGKILFDGEIVVAGYSVIRDFFVFTNKRLILVDVQGVTGKKTEYKSVPYKSISAFSIETAGTFDLDAELKIWVSNQLFLEKRFNKSVSVYELQKLLAERVG